MKSLRPHLGALAIGLLAMAGCDGRVADPLPPLETARLRLVQATVETSPLDLAVDGQVVIHSVTAATASGYVDVRAGTRTLKVSVSGSGQQVVHKVVTLEADKDYSLFVSGTLADPGNTLTSDTARIVHLPVTKLRVINATTNGLPVDVYLTGPGADLINPLVDPFVPGVDTTQFPGFVDLHIGSYEVRFTNDGTKNVLLSTGPFFTYAGELLTIVLENDNTGQLTFRMIDETPSTPFLLEVALRVVDSAPTAGPVAVHVTDPGADLSQPHPFISWLTSGDDSNMVDFVVQTHGKSKDLEVRFTGVGDLNVIASSGPFTVQAGRWKRITLQDATGGGYEAVVTDELKYLQ